MKKILSFLVVILFFGSAFSQPISRDSLRATKFLRTAMLKSMNGVSINMDNNQLKSLLDPVDPYDAVTLHMLDDYLKKSDSTTVFVTPTQLGDSLKMYVQYNDSLRNIYITDYKLDSILNQYSSDIYFGDILGDVTENKTLTDYINNVFNSQLPVDNETRLISGTVSWVSGLTYKVSDLVYKIRGKIYRSLQKYITLNTADPNLSRIDLIYADEFSNVNFITGVPGIDPVKPIASSNQLELTHAIIAPGATVPSNVIITKVYDEFLGEPDEWTTTSTAETNITVNTNSTLSPQNGAKNIHLNINVPDTNIPVGTRYLGESYQGGIIYYLTSSGKQGLIAATQDISSGAVYQSGNYSNGTQNNTGIGLGSANTDIMMTISNSNQSGMAAPLSVSYNGGGYTDWFLPSRDELTMMYQRRNYLTGLASSGERRYWSSTEAISNSSRDAYAVSFLSGGFNSPAKNTRLRVRPVRWFDDSQLLPQVIHVEKYTPTSTSITFTDNAIFDVSKGLLTFWIKSSMEWLDDSGILIELYRDNTRVGSVSMSKASNMFGYASTDSGYQQVSIRLSSFSPITPSINTVKLSLVRNWPNGISVDIDNVSIQSGTMDENDNEEQYKYWVLKYNGTEKLVYNKDTVDLQIDIPEQEDSLVHIGRIETMISPKSILVTSTQPALTLVNNHANGIGLQANGNYVGVIAESITDNGYDVGLAALGYYNPILSANKRTNVNNAFIRNITMRLNSANIPSPQAGIGTGLLWRLPILGWTLPENSDKDAGKFAVHWTNITQGAETAKAELRLTNSGATDQLAMTIQPLKTTIPGLNLSSGTANKWLALDANKDVIYMDEPSGGSSINDSLYVHRALGETMTGRKTFTEAIKLYGDAVTVASKNKHLVLVTDSTGGGMIRWQTHYWNGSSYSTTIGYGFGQNALTSNTGEASNGFGQLALSNNTGAYSNGFGYSALSNNTGTNSNGFGQLALSNNTGAYSNGFGYVALRFNTGANSNGFGHFALTYNTGTNSNGFGHSALMYNTGTNSNGFGQNALMYNTGANCNGFGFNVMELNNGDNSGGFGHHALRYNQQSNNTAVGYLANGIFLDNTSGNKTFDYTAINASTDRVTITAHGFGATGSWVNVKFTQGTSAVGGLTSTFIYQVKIIDANTISFRELVSGSIYHGIDITSAGTGTGHTLTPQYTYTNTTCLGANSQPSASNQVVLGDTNVTEVKTTGSINMGSVLKMTPLADPPTSPSLGWIYVDTDTHIYMYNGTTWKQLDN